MRKPVVLQFAALSLLALLYAGCSSSYPAAYPGTSPPVTPGSGGNLPPAVSDDLYDYHVTTNGCDCVSYATVDVDAKIDYRFQASYRMQSGISTEIQFSIGNNSDDTLSFDRGAVKVSSRNVKYQYNDKFLPLPWESILPRSSAVRKLTGKEVTAESNWHKIAGEQLTVTLKGFTLGAKVLKNQTVVFVPENPILGK